MRISDKYSYSKYRDKDLRPTGSGRVFVAPKVPNERNPIINLPAKFWGNVFLVLLLLAALWFAFFSSFFKIKEVIIEGNSLVPSQTISDAVGTGSNIFRFDSTRAKERIIASAPIIEDVAVYRGIPNALKIVVLERKPQIVWQSGENYYLVDDSGIADKQITSAEYPELIRIADHKNMKVNLGSRIVSGDFIRFAKTLSEKFSDSAGAKPTAYYVEETTFDLYVQTDGGFYVKFDTTRNAEKQLSDLKNIIASYRQNIHEYVDVRINGWAYYK